MRRAFHRISRRRRALTHKPRDKTAEGSQRRPLRCYLRGLTGMVSSDSVHHSSNRRGRSRGCLRPSSSPRRSSLSTRPRLSWAMCSPMMSRRYPVLRDRLLPLLRVRLSLRSRLDICRIICYRICTNGCACSQVETLQSQQRLFAGATRESSGCIAQYCTEVGIGQDKTFPPCYRETAAFAR